MMIIRRRGFIAPVFCYIGRFFWGDEIAAIRARVAMLLKKEAALTLPPKLVEFLIVAEDRRFMSHYGYDLVSIGRVLLRAPFYFNRQGASTINQQLVRVLTGRYERTFARKLREIIFAAMLDTFFSKEQIARCYLLVGYYGWSMNGLRAACRRIGKGLEEMTEQELALLVARLKYPEPKFCSEQRAFLMRRRGDYILALYSHKIFKQKDV